MPNTLDPQTADNKSKRASEGRVKTSAVGYCLMLGLFAGLLWGAVRWVLHLFSFTSVLPGFAADPFFRRSFLMTWQGQLTGLACFIAMSVAAAFLYKLLLARLTGSIWPGAAYGLLWWALLFLWLNPLLGIAEPIGRIEWRTLVTEGCLFVLWGVFIGSSIGFEFNDDAAQSARKARALLKS